MPLKKKVTTKIDEKGNPIESKIVDITPQEEARQQAEGNAFIRERERQAVKLMETGISNKAAVQQAGGNISRQTETGTPQISDTEIARVLALKQAATQQETTQQETTQQPQTSIFKNAPIGVKALNLAESLKLVPLEEHIKAGTKAGAIAGGAGLAIAGGAAILGAGGITAAGTTTGAGTISKILSTSTLAKIFTSKKLVTLGAIGYLARTAAAESGTILTDSLAEWEDIIKDVKDKKITLTAAQFHIDEILGNIDAAERKTKLMTKFDVFNFLGLRDTLNKFERARRTTIPNLQQQLIDANLSNRIAEARAGL